MMGWVSAPGGQERDFILGLQGPGPWGCSQPASTVQARSRKSQQAPSAAPFLPTFKTKSQPMADLELTVPN